MPIKQNPFSLYDFLGYLIPGLLFIYGIAGLNETSYHIDNISKIFSLFKSTEGIIPLAISAYITGHIIGVISSYTIERSYTTRNGFPSEQMLQLNTKEKIASFKEIKKSFSDHPFSFSSIFLAEVLLNIAFGRKSIEKKALHEEIKKIITCKIKDYFIKEHKCENIDSLMKSEFFHHIYHYCVEKSPAHLSKIQNYVALYGLFRNTALVALFMSWAIVIGSTIRAISCFSTTGQAPAFSPLLLFFGTLSFLCFSILYLGFLKFYKRYTFEVLLAFSISYEYKKQALTYKHWKDRAEQANK